MALEMPYDDLCRDLRGCVVMHENKPVYVTHIGVDGTVRFRDLLSQREDSAPFTLKAFTNPLRRIGFVNVMGSVVYVSRVPIRKFYMGLNTGNIQAKRVQGVDYPQGAAATASRIATLCIPELGDAIMDKYPVLADAVKQVKQFGGACAFDKQFAVSAEKYVFYKGLRVGKIDWNAKTTADIRWDEGKQYLSILLDGNHEKTVRDFRPSV